MDGLKRLNQICFFYRLWASISACLFDTLIEKHSVAELVSILAHELPTLQEKLYSQNLTVLPALNFYQP